MNQKTTMILKILEECRARRGLSPELLHRTIREFGFFLIDMVQFLVFGEMSKDGSLADFQKSLNRLDYDKEDFMSYIKLFHNFWQRMGEAKN